MDGCPSHLDTWATKHSVTAQTLAATEKHEWEIAFLCETLCVSSEIRKQPAFSLGPDLALLKELR